MGFLEFIILCFITLGIAWVGTWVLVYFYGGEKPAVVMACKIIWAIAILIIVLALLRATGLMSHDPKIPHV